VVVCEWSGGLLLVLLPRLPEFESFGQFSKQFFSLLHVSYPSATNLHHIYVSHDTTVYNSARAEIFSCRRHVCRSGDVVRERRRLADYGGLSSHPVSDQTTTQARQQPRLSFASFVVMFIAVLTNAERGLEIRNGTTKWQPALPLPSCYAGKKSL
ncbi:hypothetical protein M8C21_003135, partial [Ambrosia artemisiifolia]